MNFQTCLESSKMVMKCLRKCYPFEDSNVQKKLDEENLKTRLVLQVHDELVLEAPEDEVDRAKQILVEEMQNVAKLKVPLVAEAQVGDNWYEAH